jgi:hypothetical protein
MVQPNTPWDLEPAIAVGNTGFSGPEGVRIPDALGAG